MSSIFQCPVCRQPLRATPTGYQCEANTASMPPVRAIVLSVFSPANIPEFARILKQSGSLVFTCNQTIMDLLATPPYYWNIDRETKGKVAALGRLHMDVDVEIRVFRKKNGDRTGALESVLENSTITVF